MSLGKQLNYHLIKQQEENICHISFEEEYTLYHAIADGNIEKVTRYVREYQKSDAASNLKNGILSNDPLQNVKYQFVISAAIITRLCAERGLARERAYTLSDLYINAMDACTSASSVLNLQGDMLLDFTSQMINMEKEDVYSIQVNRAIDYIYQHLHQKLTVADIADTLEINSSYLSVLFKKETGQCITHFIRQKKIIAASNMLKFSEYSYAEIAEYLGFSSQSQFIQSFKRETGYTPKEYKKKYYHIGLEL